MFNADIHVKPTVPRAYTEYQLSVDYGTLNPFSAGLWGKYEGLWYRVKEYYHSGRDTRNQLTDDEYYVELEKLAGDLPIKRIIIDPSAASFITLIHRKGLFPVTEARNSVLSGIQDTATALQRGIILFNDCCEASINEFGLYSWDEKADCDRPIKENDHAMDEIRYFVYTNQLVVPQRKSALPLKTNWGALH